nr:MAG TPA: hypothetical protein [Caudoviricetes sp.]
MSISASITNVAQITIVIFKAIFCTPFSALLFKALFFVLSDFYF